MVVVNKYIILVYFLASIVIITSAKEKSRNATHEKEIEKYRYEMIFHLLKKVPFKIPSFKLTNGVEDESASAEATPLNNDIVIFYLYNRKFPHNSIIINEDLRLINKNLPTKMLVHGWTEHYYVEWCRNLTEAYLLKGDFNIIVFDWSKKGDADYISASTSVKGVGDIVGDYIVEKLMKIKKMSLKSIHLISHSLGCHVAAMTGQRVMKKAGKKLGRITALDPAAPFFDMFTMGNNDRLSPDDADFVDIVHTDSGMLGFKTSIGTVDYYPNGGRAIQPGCSLLRPDVKYEDLFCSHARSHRYFLRSVVQSDIKAVPCDSWESYASGQCNKNRVIPFGDESPTNISGTYYLKAPNDPIKEVQQIYHNRLMNLGS